MSDLSDLFARDPLGLTNADIDVIVTRMREAQAQFELGIKPAAKPAAPKKGALDLKSLGLDL